MVRRRSTPFCHLTGQTRGFHCYSHFSKRAILGHGALTKLHSAAVLQCYSSWRQTQDVVHTPASTNLHGSAETGAKDDMAAPEARKPSLCSISIENNWCVVREAAGMGSEARKGTESRFASLSSLPRNRPIRPPEIFLIHLEALCASFEHVLSTRNKDAGCSAVYRENGCGCLRGHRHVFLSFTFLAIIPSPSLSSAAFPSPSLLFLLTASVTKCHPL